jgi:hypothetical protein
MFKDTDDALRRIESQLLAEEEESIAEPEEYLEDEALLLDDPDDFGEAPAQYENFSNRYGRVRAFNSDDADLELEEYSDRVQRGKGGGLLKLMLTAAVLLVAIAALLAWWVIRLKG